MVYVYRSAGLFFAAVKRHLTFGRSRAIASGLPLNASGDLYELSPPFGPFCRHVFCGCFACGMRQ